MLPYSCGSQEFSGTFKVPPKQHCAVVLWPKAINFLGSMPSSNRLSSCAACPCQNANIGMSWESMKSMRSWPGRCFLI